MLFWLIPSIILIVSLGVVGYLVFLHYPEITAVDANTDPVRRRKGIKNELFAKRLERLGKGPAESVFRALGIVWKAAVNIGKNMYVKAVALERHYRRLEKENISGVSGNLEARMELKKEAEELLEKEAYAAAEQRLIELISLDPRRAETYELLGRVYLASRQYDQAKETFQYAHQLAPEDASVTVSLGELALREGDMKKAVKYFGEAVNSRPGNPKYLDFLIEASLLCGDKRQAARGLALLKEANPDNQKIREFEGRIRELT